MYAARDYTRLIERENKLWSFDDYALPGLGIQRLVVGAVASGAAVLLVGGLATVTGQGLLWIPAIIVGVIVGLVVYMMAGRLNADHMSLLSSLVVRFDWTFRQPRRLTGFTRDSEPDSLHWRVITWEATTPEWVDAFNRGKEHP